MLKKIVVVALAVLVCPAVLMAAEGAPLPTGEGVYTFLKAGLALATGLGIGLAAFGGALGQGRAAASALEGIARNPEAAGKVMTPMIIALALIESLVIYSLVISFMLLGKI
ncbi:MAG: ATP synthase F0 subunit C [Deltaproteobacteria bacterium RIFCSPLOWO2_01_44_7]|nr:MAG: ATP synthase F0 subunit C [Deltaproteobacteria bacterium RIFCSPHIGHO2_01_FULL_43_49]OGQ16722.1 MAG: ATP synthase F0 subunit C [Deltaproteobacteria bacterium RIFCSPHIGHO2_02_FULL_44_53]OGQ29860.1 MAG: ATP synthase F0 subunit C [Deltaproteobacteria bacterium RIFCSPHIGHO2_12_FULL_44_21]OGQ33150.1 MAG: ATP synthase F0 subunit C [Deltaproteobacteria bacterium RIFCSPLOWO2_01_FULL_45_74]OGQ42245.1 MAG: ATP synthase F0 subunit C [Deltaproteobacteria bacterium RIFCSPLOWO2_02_FULL_44_34]OGQ43699